MKELLKKIFSFLLNPMPKSTITYCPLCKSYQLDGVKWSTRVEHLPGYEKAQRQTCYGCRSIIQAAKSKIGLDIDNLGAAIQFTTKSAIAIPPEQKPEMKYIAIGKEN